MNDEALVNNWVLDDSKSNNSKWHHLRKNGYEGSLSMRLRVTGKDLPCTKLHQWSIYPKSAPEAVSRVSVWKRYSDFRKLYLELSSRHDTLRIKEAFPPFPKPKFFGRFEAEVIEERRQCAIRLLEFVARHTPLFTSNVVVKFFESGHARDYLTDCSASIGSDTSEEDPNLNSALRGTSYVPTTVQNTQFPTLNGRTIILANNDIETSDNGSQSLSVNNNCIDEIGVVSENGVNISGTKPINNKNDGEKIERQSPTCDRYDASKFTASLQASNGFSVHDGSDLPEGAAEDLSSYILVSAAHMSAAFRHEAVCEYEEAFTLYKLGIANLLNGVQSDPDYGRRATIRDKISKYLEKAERLYNRHLNCNVGMLSKPTSELGNYKVLRVIGSVMLVRDTSRDCNRVIKTVQKPAGCLGSLRDYILRGKIPFMVRLYACIETDSTIFLVLHYASGEKLWEYIKLYYKGRNTVSNWREKGHTRSVSCDAIIQSSLGKKKLEVKERLLPKIDGLGEVSKDRACGSRENLDPQDEETIDPDESLRRLEAKFGANAAPVKTFQTTDLLAKAQELLRLVDATLKKSNSIASRLNESGTLLYSEDKPDHSRNLAHGEKFQALNVTEIDKLSQGNSIDGVHGIGSGNIDLKAKNKRSDEALANSKSNFVKNFKVEDELVKESSKLNGSHRVIEETMKSGQLQSIGNEDSGIEMDDELWKLPEGTIRYWAAEILLALESLHQQGVIVGNLKPDNILLGSGGHVAMTYIVPKRSFELLQLKKPYSAPELCIFSPTIPPSTAADVWSYGVLLYELFTGIKFQTKHPGPYHSHSILNIPEELSANVKSLISNVLRYNPEERLTIPEIKESPFFSGIDWTAWANSSFT
ncbi:ribosomal protein S6 kinase delta-1 isoform X1 [Neodiprion fabricii]|uniref:ribosomal protein S6 kinase delta-1 isoform X1 n=1 Tax=Neodiprion fabricii TaxID=2872261 RepID=UPI001ED94D81|nr:ribosomal protein S6 kinase delta-1 isoform X1 [Neodiprion fabricii]